MCNMTSYVNINMTKCALKKVLKKLVTIKTDNEFNCFRCIKSSSTASAMVKLLPSHSESIDKQQKTFQRIRHHSKFCFVNQKSVCAAATAPLSIHSDFSETHSICDHLGIS